MVRVGTKIAILSAIAGIGIAGSVAALPASAASADCIVSIINRAPSIACYAVSQAEARARADCAYAPDTYTAWVRSYQTSVGGRCLFAARRVIQETRGI